MINLELSYEYNNHVYKLTAERTKQEKEEGEEDAYLITFNGRTYPVTASEIKPGYLRIKFGDKTIKAVIAKGNENRFVFLNGNTFNMKRVLPTSSKKIEKKNGLLSPISGKVVNVKVEEGVSVKKGDILMVIEAMKMEYLIKAPFDGIVKKIFLNVDEQIDMGMMPIEIEKTEEG